VPFARALEGGLLLVGAAAEDDRLWMLVYDASRNIPSGRIPGVVSDGVDVYLFDAAVAAEPVRLADRLPLGSFDNLIFTSVRNGSLTACAVERCRTIARDGTMTIWPTTLGTYEFVEAVFDSAGGAHAIVRPKDDHVSGDADIAGFHYALATITDSMIDITPLPTDCVPFDLKMNAGTTEWSCARGRADLAALLKADIARMPNDGLIDFAASNLEGRVAWSQAYYLNGLLQLGGDRLPALTAAADWTALRSRLRAEVDLLAQRVESTQGLQSKRYSLQRTNVIFALHLGRTARILATAAHTGHGSVNVDRARASLQARLRSLDGTVEQPMTASEQGIAFATLGYVRGMDFWCDGSNVPYNYISGVVDGMLSADVVTSADLDSVSTLLQPLLSLEPLANAAHWRYWWSWGSHGWSAADGVSVNTPIYAGNSGVAHITYRSMDAAAVLGLARQRPLAVDPQVSAHLAALVASGALNPWVTEFLAPGSLANMDVRVAYRYARVSAPWELQSQLWALERLAMTMP
jgi:hypothetical protein